MPKEGKYQNNMIFEDDSDESEKNDLDQLRVNESYKAQFDGRKQRQELSRAREMGYTLSDEDKDLSSEDEGQELTYKKEAEILNVIQMIKDHDPRIMDKDFKPFEQFEKEEEKDGESKTDVKRLTAKDMLREQVLSGNVASSDEESNEEEKPHKSYDQEMKDFRESMLKEIKECDGNDSDDDLFTKREHIDDDELEFKEFIERDVDVEKKNRVKTFLNSNPSDEKEEFLLDYVRKMRWKDETDDYVPNYSEVIDDKTIIKEDLDEDIKDIDQQDRFEHLFNTRYEQDNLIMYPRNIEGSMRRPKDKRKLERDAKRIYPDHLTDMRQEDERKRREEELRRLRALKRHELDRKLNEIQRISGDDAKVQEINLDEDWDPEKHDQVMQKAFDDDYFDGDNEDDLKKPDLHLGDIFDEDEIPDNLKEIESDEEDETIEEENQDDNDNDRFLLEDETPINETPIEEEEEKERLMNELYQLDYEDMIGDMPVRFHYTKVLPNSFGLSTDDIIQSDERDLRSFVSMKKLATYRDHEWRVSKAGVGKYKAMLKKHVKRSAEEEEKNRKLKKKEKKKEKKELERMVKKEEEYQKEQKKKRSRKNKNK